jgi:hypothetical protein
MRSYKGRENEPTRPTVEIKQDDSDWVDCYCEKNSWEEAYNRFDVMEKYREIEKSNKWLEPNYDEFHYNKELHEEMDRFIKYNYRGWDWKVVNGV